VADQRIRDGGDGTYYHYFDDVDAGFINATAPISNDEWAMWTCRWDGTEIDLVKNSPPASDSNPDADNLLTTAGNSAIGGNVKGDAEYLDGIVAFVAIFTAHKPDSFVERFFQRSRGIFGV